MTQISETVIQTLLNLRPTHLSKEDALKRLQKYHSELFAERQEPTDTQVQAFKRAFYERIEKKQKKSW